MANSTISDLSAVTVLAADDLYVVVDVSDTSMAASGTNKKLTHQSLLANIKLDDLAVPDDNTDLNVSSSRHGLCPKLPNNPKVFLNGEGGYASPEIQSYICSGVYDYNDAATTSSPISIAVADIWYDLTNDGAGTYTNLDNVLPSAPNIWNVSTNQFDFSSLELGDSVDIRLDITVTTSLPNQEVETQLLAAIGGTSYAIQFNDIIVKTAGAKHLVVFSSIYIGDANTLDNPAKFQIKSDSTGSVVVTGWYCKVNKRVAEIVVG